MLSGWTVILLLYCCLAEEISIPLTVLHDTELVVQLKFGSEIMNLVLNSALSETVLFNLSKSNNFTLRNFNFLCISFKMYLFLLKAMGFGHSLFKNETENWFRIISAKLEEICFRFFQILEKFKLILCWGWIL
jgi:hypothetical protein